MKRSEMIEELAKELRHFEQINNYSEEKLVELSLTPYLTMAEVFLDKAEKLGMLPPGASFERSGIGCLCAMYESCGACGGVDINEWEPE